MKPNSQDLIIAIMWLESNEGDNGEADNCKIVAQYLNKLLTKTEESEMINDAAQKAGLLPSVLKRRLKQQELNK